MKRLYTGPMNCCASGGIDADSGPKSIWGGNVTGDAWGVSCVDVIGGTFIERV